MKTPAELLLSEQVAWFLDHYGIPLPTCPPRWKTPEAGEVLHDANVRFDDRKLWKLINEVFPKLMHTQGRWAGKPLRPDPWQIAYIIAPVYGWKRKDDESGKWVRIVRTEYVDVPRKNGKTTIAGAQAVILMAADGEPGAQIYAAACAKDQARFCFDPVRAFCDRSPALKDFMRSTNNRITYTPDWSYGSYFQVVSSAADLLHGANVHGAVIDELHKHKNRELVDALETGTGARDQPLIVIITTADDGRPNTIYAEKRKYCEQLARKTITDPSFYGVIWAVDDGDDPFVEPTWIKANPGYGISPTKSFLEAEAKKAQNSPANLARFKRLHLGVRTKQETKFIDLPEWDRNSSIVTEERLKGKRCYGGLDLSSTNDLCALALDFPDGIGGHDVIWRLWMPEAKLTSLDERTAGSASVWVRGGFLTLTPGAVVDYEFLKAQIGLDADFFDIAEIGFDPWNSSQIVIDLETSGMKMEQVRQGFGTLSSPTKELLRLLLEGTAEIPRYRHGGNPALRWQVDNFAVVMDPAGNVKPSKDAAGDKIDGVVAGIMALSRSMRHTAPRRSAYEDHGLMTAEGSE